MIGTFEIPEPNFLPIQVEDCKKFLSNGRLDKLPVVR